jgi:protease PrsW
MVLAESWTHQCVDWGDDTTGLLAPFGHGVWTGILGAIVFRASTPNHFRITGMVIVVYLFVSLLHGCWDGFSLPIPYAMDLVLGAIGLTTLIVLYRQAERRQLQENAAGSFIEPH